MHKSQQLSYLSLSSVTLFNFRENFSFGITKQTDTYRVRMSLDWSDSRRDRTLLHVAVSAYTTSILTIWHLLPLPFWFRFQFRKRPFIINTWLATNTLTSTRLLCGRFVGWPLATTHRDEWFSIRHFLLPRNGFRCLYVCICLSSKTNHWFDVCMW